MDTEEDDNIIRLSECYIEECVIWYSIEVMMTFIYTSVDIIIASIYIPLCKTFWIHVNYYDVYSYIDSTPHKCMLPQEHQQVLASFPDSPLVVYYSIYL